MSSVLLAKERLLGSGCTMKFCSEERKQSGSVVPSMELERDQLRVEGATPTREVRGSRLSYIGKRHYLLEKCPRFATQCTKCQCLYTRNFVRSRPSDQSFYPLSNSKTRCNKLLTTYTSKPQAHITSEPTPGPASSGQILTTYRFASRQ